MSGTNQIEIIVRGETKSGKSTIAEEIRDFLDGCGFLATVDDEPHTSRWITEQIDRLEALAGTEVVIRTAILTKTT